MPAGRPPKLNTEERAEVFEAFKDYIVCTEDPTIVGFCAYNETAIKYWVTKDNMNDWEEFSDLRKLSVQKQEAYLVKNATQNKVNPTVAIFRLKQPQHGYTDKQNLDHTTNGKDLAPVLVQFIGEDGNNPDTN
jgi:hypothetical protein